MSLPSNAAGSGGQIFDLRLKGVSVQRSLELVYWNISADISLFRVLDQREGDVSKVFGADEIGLPIDASWASYGCAGPECREFAVLGYPASRDGLMQTKWAQLNLKDLPTEDTSNFGDVVKFKLMPSAHEGEPLAEPGMSGGPIINSLGRVVGIAIERPIDRDELIGSF